MGALRAGDALVVWRLDRLGRSLRHLIEAVNDLRDRGIGFRSLQEAIDTSTSGGKLVFYIFGALAEFERELAFDDPLALAVGSWDPQHEARRRYVTRLPASRLKDPGFSTQLMLVDQHGPARTARRRP
jgi:hypothetical protein